MTEKRYEVSDLLAIMSQLRDPDTGCPWDRQQTFESIVPSTIEEAYELADAIRAGDYHHVAEELGDLLFQVVFYTQLGSEQGHFDFADIVTILAEKLIRRHPHVFARAEGDYCDDLPSIESVKQTWEAIKAQERESRAQRGVLADVPLALPALMRAQKLQKRAATVGFDWPDREGVLEKLQEEIAEFLSAVASTKQTDIHDELGDLFFTLVNVSRHFGADAEQVLRNANEKFSRRFQRMEQATPVPLEDLSSAEWELLWSQAKTET